MAPSPKPKNDESPAATDTTTSMASSVTSGSAPKEGSEKTATTADHGAGLPDGAEALKVECGKLIEENVVLKRCLKLMRDNSCLETASLLAAIVAFCDGKFRRRFADGLECFHAAGLAEFTQTEEGLTQGQPGKITPTFLVSGAVRLPSPGEVPFQTSPQSQSRPQSRPQSQPPSQPHSRPQSQPPSQPQSRPQSLPPSQPQSQPQSRPRSQPQSRPHSGPREEADRRAQQAQLAHDPRFEPPEKDVPQQGQRTPTSPCPKSVLPLSREGRDGLQEVPERDGSPRGGRPPCTSCRKSSRTRSPPVSVGGRQLKSEHADPYLYASSPDSKHMQSHMQTRTPVMSDLEYDALYLRSLALAAGYRALAKGLDPKSVPPSDQYHYVSLGTLCKTVANIPPNRLYMKMGKKYPKERVVLHSCVSHKPTECEPFTREGKRPVEMDPFAKNRKENPSTWTRPVYETYVRSLKSPPGDGGLCHHKKPYIHPINRSADRHMAWDEQAMAEYRGHNIEACPTCGRCGNQSPSATEKSPCRGLCSTLPARSKSSSSKTLSGKSPSTSKSPSSKSPSSGKKAVQSPQAGKEAGKPEKEDSDYDFQKVVEPIIDQARQSISQVTGGKDDVTSFHLTHTHTEYKYKEDGSAVVQSDMYKKSYNWESSDEEGSSKKTTSHQATVDEMQEVSASKALVVENVQELITNVHSETTTTSTAENTHYSDTSSPQSEVKDEGKSPRQSTLKVSGSIAKEDHHNKTNNYPNSRSESETQSGKEDPWTPVSPTAREVDWASHCHVTSPFSVVVPKPLRPALPQPHAQPPRDYLPRPQPLLDCPAMLLPGQTMEVSPPGVGPRSAALQLPSKLSAWDSVTGYHALQPTHPTNTELKMLAVDLAGNSLLGEVAFQLERRILDYVFANCLPDWALSHNDTARRRRFYGYTVNNIGEMINREALAGEHYSRGTERILRERLRTVLDILTPMGYDLLDHGQFSQDTINKYGLLCKPPAGGRDLNPEVGLPGLEVADVQNFIAENTDSEQERHNLLLLFDCLRLLAIEDGRPLFVW